MYTKFGLAKKYLHYYITASNGKGHGVHSPFVFDFIKNVLNDKKKYEGYTAIESLRRELKQDDTILDVRDFGAGSLAVSSRQKKVSDIARAFLKPKKYAQLLFRIAQYYKPAATIELGTSLGITTAYLACASPKVYTMEGSGEVAAIAENNFKKLGLTNIEIIEGNFDNTLPLLLSKLQKVDLAFIDGNHRKLPTLDYFDQLLNKSTGSTILIFDDIHWSTGMEEAWEEIKAHPDVTLTIDLFFIGLVFFKKDFRSKQHFTIRF
jgi:predicted O-methyltransferase YrrM